MYSVSFPLSNKMGRVLPSQCHDMVLELHDLRRASATVIIYDYIAMAMAMLNAGVN